MESTRNRERTGLGDRIGARAERVSDGENGGAGGANAVDPIDGDPPGDPSTYPCPQCERRFPTKIGLGVHVRRRHPVEANEAIDVERVKMRWNPEEMRLVARAEANAIIAGGVRFMNLHLLGLFPDRTIESIKGKRRDPEYRAMVEMFCQQGPAVTLQAETDDGQVDAGQPEGPDPLTGERADGYGGNAALLPPAGQPEHAGLIEAILDLIQRCRRIRAYQSARLCDIAQAAIEGQPNVEDISTWLNTVFPTVERPRTTRYRARPPVVQRENRKQRRKREYGMVQELYRKNLNFCLKKILDGDAPDVRPAPGEFEAYWRPLLETRSVENGLMPRITGEVYDVNRVRATVEPPNVGVTPDDEGEGADAPGNRQQSDRTSLWRPVTVVEVTRNAVRLGSAPGPDGISPRQWNAVPAVLRALCYNLLLLARAAPDALLSSHTIFLEKSGMPERPAPSDYRPLSIGTVGIRQFHKILAARLVSLDLVDSRQRAFRPADGVFENTTILSCILKDARRKIRSLHVATVDVSKAFDTVAHEAIHRALEELGLPPGFLQYIRNTYARATTTLKLQDRVTAPIHLGRGVKQGDPLSPLLFNLVVDRALGVLSEEVGYTLEGVRVNALAYADDIVLMSSTPRGLQENLKRIEYALERSGLAVNQRKSGVLSMMASGRDKKVKIVADAEFRLQGGILPQRSVLDVWSYLGNTYNGAKDNVADVTGTFRECLAKITKAPLKPQQRLQLLRVCLLPRFYHQWVVGVTTSKTLKAIDTQVRAAVRTWLRLPHDAPTGYFHASIRAGGLGIPMLKVFIPILKRLRLQRLCQSTFPAAQAASVTTHVANQITQCEQLMRVDGVRVTKVSELWKQVAVRLHNSNDGTGLKEAPMSRLSTDWVSASAGGIPGADYVHYHHIRANCLPTRARCSRGRRHLDGMCRAGCPERETPAHCVQRCFRTHGGRILRHDDLCRQVAGFLRQKGFDVLAEKAFNTSVGRRRPDLIISKGNTAYVLDAQVVSSEGSLNRAHELKVEKYEANEDLGDQVAELCRVPRNNVVFTALTISWRGVWSSHSELELRGFGLTFSQLRTLTTRVLWGSWLGWKRFNAITSRYNPRFDNRRRG